MIYQAIYRAIYQLISGDLSAYISNISRFLLQTIWRTIFPYRIGSRQKKEISDDISADSADI